MSIYLDHGATSYPKPAVVHKAVLSAMMRCTNPGRGGYREAMEAARQVYLCREAAGALFSCTPEQVVFTGNCTQGLNMAIRTLVRPGDRVLISGFEHNSVTRPLHLLGARVQVAGRCLFDWDNTLTQWENALQKGVDAAVFTHVSNVFGYILPLQDMAWLCKKYGVPFAVDAAQSAGNIPLDFASLGADFVAMPGHKGLLGPQGTGLLLCARLPQPLLAGGTGSLSVQQTMPDFLPDGAEAGTLNVPGISGLHAGIAWVTHVGLENIQARQRRQIRRCIAGLQKTGVSVFSGEHQGGTLSFLPKTDCEETAKALAQSGIAVRAGLHCAPLAHESAGTLETGTVRVSFGYDASDVQTDQFLQKMRQLKWGI